jgi:hypothetical protein
LVYRPSFLLLEAMLVSAGSRVRELVGESVGRLGCWSEGLWGIGHCCLGSRLRGRERGGVRFLRVE